MKKPEKHYQPLIDIKAKYKKQFIDGGMYNSTLSCCNHAMTSIGVVTANAQISKDEDDKYIKLILDSLRSARGSIDQAISNMEIHEHYQRIIVDDGRPKNDVVK